MFLLWRDFSRRDSMMVHMRWTHQDVHSNQRFDVATAIPEHLGGPNVGCVGSVHFGILCNNGIPVESGVLVCVSIYTHAHGLQFLLYVIPCIV